MPSKYATTSGLPPLARAHAEALRNLVREASERNTSQTFVIEGPHLLERAFESASARIKEILFTNQALEAYPSLAKRAERKNISTYLVADKLAERISDTKSPQGIFAVMAMSDSQITLEEDSLVMALDGVQDPGNVGTIIRTAAWFGVRHIFLGSGCADPYSSKVLRATQGEIFVVSVGQRGELRSSLLSLQHKGFQVLAATIDSSAGSLYKTSFAKKIVLVFGSEAHGVGKQILGMADGQIIIPKFGQGESLNVATSVGIMLSEVMRKRQ